MTGAAYRHPTATELADLLHGRLPAAAAQHIEQHLTACLACKVWHARLAAAEPTPDVPPSALDRLHRVLAAMHTSAVLGPPGTHGRVPQAGQLWQVGDGETLIVWVWRVLDDGDSALVIPAVLDTGLADELTLIVPAADNPLGDDLAIMVSAEAHIRGEAFRDYQGVLDIAGPVRALREARRGTGSAVDLPVGPPITDASDQRLEYRGILTDLLADYGPALHDPDCEAAATDDSDRSAVSEPEYQVDLAAVNSELEALPSRRADCHIERIDVDQVAGEDLHALWSAALVRELDHAVLVTVLTGPPPLLDVLEDDATARMAGVALTGFPHAQAVAVAAYEHQDGVWAVVVPSAYAVEAIEQPSGTVRGPRTANGRLPLGDALFKHLESTCTNLLAAQTGIRIDWEQHDAAAVAAHQAALAVQQQAKAGRTARIQAKQAGYGNAASSDFADRLTSAITGILAGDRPADTITELLSRSGQ